jgi:hypothetical protein
VEDNVTTGGFWGEDGFTLPDLGILLDLGTDTFSTVWGATTGQYPEPIGGASGSGFGAGMPAQSFTGVYVGIGLVVLLLAVLVFVIARK